MLVLANALLHWHQIHLQLQQTKSTQILRLFRMRPHKGTPQRQFAYTQLSVSPHPTFCMRFQVPIEQHAGRDRND